MKYTALLWVLGIVLMAACSRTQKNDPTGETSPTFGGFSSLPTIPAFAVVETATEVAIIAADDPRLPIQPDLAGQLLYETNCANCHGLAGKGQYPDDPYKLNDQGLAGAPPHDSTGHTWHHPDQVLIETIYRGQTLPNFQPMPAFGDKLTQSDIFSILAYIKTWWGSEELEVQRGATNAAKQP